MVLIMVMAIATLMICSNILYNDKSNFNIGDNDSDDNGDNDIINNNSNNKDSNNNTDNINNAHKNDDNDNNNDDETKTFWFDIWSRKEKNRKDAEWIK